MFTLGPDFDSLKRNVAKVAPISAEVKRRARRELGEVYGSEVVWCQVERLSDGSYSVTGEIATSGDVCTYIMPESEER